MHSRGISELIIGDVTDPIEREMRRRIFFLLFCADKSESVLLGRPVKMREEDCYSLRLPEELLVKEACVRTLTGLMSNCLRDDEYITETRYLHQPKGYTSLITGLNAAIRIYCREHVLSLQYQGSF